MLSEIDVAFPLIHGPSGEDGTLQGLLELARVPYAGAGVAASAAGLDKALMKALLRDAGLPVIDWLVMTRPQWAKDAAGLTRRSRRSLATPASSSRRTAAAASASRRRTRARSWSTASPWAFRFDRKLIVEKGVEPREIECAVLGNDEPEASPLGEIVCEREFYDYEAKYLDSSTTLSIPAKLPRDRSSRIRALALDAYRAIDCCGMARVDFFLTPEGEVFVDELNTIPGFTPGSMYPRLWQVAGLSYSDLISRLVDLGLERFEERERLAQG